MKHHQYKLRITAMLLTFLLTATALFGCSTTESTPTEPHVNLTQYTEPEITPQPSDAEPEDDIVYPVMEPYLGTWVLAQQKAQYTEMTITFHPDKTAEYNGATYTWKVDSSGHHGSIYLTPVSVNDSTDNAYRGKNNHLSVFTTDEGDIYLYLDDGFYFHEDYLAKFDKVPLTTENICDYMHVEHEYRYVTDDFGRLVETKHYYYTTFKEGMGLASWCVGDLTYQINLYDIYFYVEPGTEKLGDLNDSFTATDLQSILNIPEDTPTRESFITHFKEADEHLREIRMKELIGAEIVIGEVYVPKN